MNIRRKRLLSYAVLCIAPIALFSASLARDARPSGDAAPRTADHASPVGQAIAAVPRPRAAGLSGKVSNTRGEPIAGATVCAVCADCNMYLPDAERSCARSDGAGHYALRRVRAGDYHVSASAPGYLPSVAHAGKAISLSAREPHGRTGIDIELAEGGAAIAGVVLDVTGGPVAGAVVHSITGTESHTSLRTSQTATSDDLGRFTLACPPGHVALHARADGYAPGFASTTAPATDIELFVEPASSIHGVVVSGEGQPVAGIGVFAEAQGLPSRKVESDGSGRFALGDLRSGVYRLRASGAGWLGDYPATIALSTADSARDVAITVRRAATVRGTLLTSNDTPCAHGRVHIGPQERSFALPILNAISSVEGAVIFDAVPPGTYAVSIACGDAEFQPAPPLEVGESDRSDVRWKLAPQLAVSGHVLDARGQPVPKLVVELRTVSPPMMSRSSASAQDGSFSFPGVEKGSYVLRSPDLDGELPVEVGQWSVSGLRLRAKAMGALHVRVTTRDGKPLNGLSISAQSGERPSDLPEELGDGAYRLSPLQAGAYAVYVGDGVNPRLRAGGPTGETIVREGETTQLQLEYGGYTGRIAGRVIDDQGAPIENVWVQAKPAGADSDPLAELQQMTVLSESRRALTDQEGRFELDGLAEDGRFVVSAEWPLGGQARREDVQAGASVELVLEQLASLAGTAVDPSGRPVAHLSLQIANEKTGQQRQDVVFDPNGKWQLDDVTPGEVQLIASDAHGHVAITKLTLAPKQKLGGVQLRLEARPTN